MPIVLASKRARSWLLLAALLAACGDSSPPSEGRGPTAPTPSAGESPTSPTGAATPTGTLASNVVVVSSANPVVVGRPVTLTIAVAPSMSTDVYPTGTVTLAIDGAKQAPVPITKGTAQVTLSALASGPHTVVATYGGDAKYAESASRPFNQIAQATFRAPWPRTGSVDVSQHGAVGDGTTDNTSALRSLIANTPNGTLFYFPKGTYLLSGTVDFTSHQTVGMLGDVDENGAPTSIVRGADSNAAPVILGTGEGVNFFHITNMEFASSPSIGTAVYAKFSAESSIENAVFRGHVGLSLVWPFNVALRKVKFLGPGADGSGSIGLITNLTSNGLVDESTFSGWDEGMRTWGAGVSVIRSRFENNGTGLRLGADENGNNWIHGGSAMSDLSFVDNDIGIYTQSVVLNSFTNVSITGTARAPHGESQIGLFSWFQAFSTHRGLKVGGTFSDSAVRIDGGGLDHTTFYAADVTNDNPAGKGLNTVDNVTMKAASFASADLGPVMDLDNVLASHTVASEPGPIVDVTKFGVVGDDATDNTAAVQALIDKATPGTTFYFPVGVYRVSAPLDFSKLPVFDLVGDLSSSGGSRVGSVLAGGGEVLIKADYGSGAGTFHVRNIALLAANMALYSRNSVLSSVENCGLGGDVGMLHDNPFMLAVQSVAVAGYGGLPGGPPRQTGLILNGGMRSVVEQGDFMGLIEGVRASGTDHAIYASRFEVNHVAMNLGLDANGNKAPLLNASVSGIGDLEANDTSVAAPLCIGCSFAGLSSSDHINANTNTPTIVGLTIGESRDCTFASVGIQGEYSQAATFIADTAQNLLFSSSYSATQTTGAPAWIVKNTTTTFINTDSP